MPVFALNLKLQLRNYSRQIINAGFRSDTLGARHAHVNIYELWFIFRQASICQEAVMESVYAFWGN